MPERSPFTRWFVFPPRKGVDYWQLAYCFCLVAAIVPAFLIAKGHELSLGAAIVLTSIPLAFAPVAFNRMRHHEKRLARDPLGGNYRPLSLLRLHVNALLLALLCVALSLVRER